MPNEHVTENTGSEFPRRRRQRLRLAAATGALELPADGTEKPRCECRGNLHRNAVTTQESASNQGRQPLGLARRRGNGWRSPRT